MKYMMLKEVCSIKMGQSPASDSYNDNGEGVPFFQGNADFGERYPVARKWCSAPMKMAEPEDILISVRAPIGALNYAKEECCIGRGLAALTPNKSKILPEYMFWLLKGKNAELNSKGTGSTFKAIGRKVLEEILVPDIGMEQQMEYAVNLEKINGIIQLRKQDLQKLDDLIKSRFIELFGDPVANDKNWPIEELDSICSAIVDCPHSTPSYTAENTGYMCIRSSIVKKNHILWDEIEYIPEHEYRQRILRKKPEKGDIIYTREGAILGIAAMIDRNCNVALGQRSMLLSPNNSICLPQFLSVAMNYDSFLRKALGGISGSASPHINVGDIKAFAIILPPIALQEQFVTFVEQTDKSKLFVNVYFILIFCCLRCIINTSVKSKLSNDKGEAL